MRLYTFARKAMFVCVCNAVSDKAIVNAIDDGARSVADLRRSLGLGSCCGKCVPAARALIREHTEATAPAAGVVHRYTPTGSARVA